VLDRQGWPMQTEIPAGGGQFVRRNASLTSLRQKSLHQ
jgi:hypothetical protein